MLRAIFNRWFGSRKPKPRGRADRGREQAARALRVGAKYDAAQTTDNNRRHWANADALSPAAANSAAVRAILRKRSRYEVANSSYARGITLTLANDMIGTGPRLQVRTPSETINRAIEAAFAEWADAVDLPGKLRTFVLARVVDGETFAQFVTNDLAASRVKLDLRLFEADHVGASSFASLDDEGISYDAAGNPTWYEVAREHPGDMGLVSYGVKVDRVPASRIIHWFRAERPGQRRGIPHITPALELFAQLRRYTLAVLTAAETAANFSAMLESDLPPDEQDRSGEAFDTLPMERGMLTTLPNRHKLSQLRAEQPTTTYDAFTAKVLNEIARCLNMPYNVAAGNSASYNYSSGRLDHQTYYRSIEVDRADCERRVLNRIFFAWLEEAERIPDYLPSLEAVGRPAIFWFWDGQRHVDPVKEAQADEIELRIGTTTLAEKAAAKGQDWEELLEQQARELKKRKELGLPVPGAASPAANAPAKPADKSKSQREEDGDDPAEDEGDETQPSETQRRAA